MAIATLAAYKQALADQREIISIQHVTVSVAAGRPYDLWLASVPLGAVPGAAAVPTNATLGALGQLDPASGQLSIVSGRFSALNPGQYLICDRLSHQGGLSGTVAGAQTTNLPTAALTRFTTGDGVMIGLTIYTQIGTTATTVSVSYTNQAGTGGRTSPLVAMGGTAFREANRLILIPLAAGDTGVRSVESVSLTGTTATAGAFGVTLFKPIFGILVTDGSGVLSAGGFITGNTWGGVATIPNGACLFSVSLTMGVNAMGCGAILLDEN